MNEINRIYEMPLDTNAVPVKAGVKISAGMLVAKTSAGYGQPFVQGDDNYLIGFALESVDNTDGADGDKIVSLKSSGKVSLFLSGITVADVGHAVNATGANGFSMTDGNPFGKLIRFEKADYGIVLFDCNANLM
jgi:hypothetical protein